MRIPTLDGLRAVAILIVIASHADLVGGNIGHLGVMIFFSISGYLITTRLIDEHRENGCISLRAFYLRRAFRILPPVVVYLAVIALLAFLGAVACNASQIWAAMLFYVNYLHISGYVGHFWSLSVEEHFYLLWPFFLVFFGVLIGWRTAAVLAMAILAWRLGDNHFRIVSSLFNAPNLQQYNYRTDLIADTILWGCCLAFVKPRFDAAASTLAAIVCALALYGMASGSYFMQNLHFVPALLLGAIVSCPTAPLGRLLETIPMRFIGRISYSLYIWQQLFFTGHKVPVIIALPATFACAYLSYRFIEQPFIRFAKRLEVAPHRAGAIKRAACHPINNHAAVGGKT